MAQADAITQTPFNPLRFLARRPALKAVSLSAATAVVLVVRNTDDGPAWRVTAVLTVLIGVAALLVFKVAVPRAKRRQSAHISARRALVLAVLAGLSVAVFWTALPPVFAFSSFALVADSEDLAGRLSNVAKAALGLSAVASMAGLVLAVVG